MSRELELPDLSLCLPRSLLSVVKAVLCLGAGRGEDGGGREAVRPQGAEDRHLDWRRETGQA